MWLYESYYQEEEFTTEDTGDTEGGFNAKVAEDAEGRRDDRQIRNRGTQEKKVGWGTRRAKAGDTIRGVVIEANQKVLSFWLSSSWVLGFLIHDFFPPGKE